MSNIKDIHEHLIDKALDAGLKVCDVVFDIDDIPSSAIERAFIVLYPDTEFNNPTTNLQYNVDDSISIRFLWYLKNNNSWLEAKIKAEELIKKIINNKVCNYAIIPTKVQYRPDYGNCLLVIDIDFTTKRRLYS